MKDFDRWIYHETKAPQIIKDSEFERMEAEGWADSPARFIKLETLGISQAKIEAGDEQEESKAQQALDAVEGVVASLNGALNLDKLDKNELEAYAKEHFGVDVDKRRSKKRLVEEIKELAGV